MGVPILVFMVVMLIGVLDVAAMFEDPAGHARDKAGAVGTVQEGNQSIGKIHGKVSF
jgi:hypothetical protein